MELLYNPDQMSEKEIKETFVAREALVDELVELIKSQPDSAGMQHAVIIAPRGMGKTTVLLMVKFAIKDCGLANQWQAVKFPEESYGIYDLSDFWIETLNLIAADTADTDLRRLADDLKKKYPNNEDLQDAAYAALKDWRQQHGKRLLLLVENFDQILEQINDERDNARLRDELMNDSTVMFLGGATTFFREARAYDQPLYNFFKIYDLADLKFAQMQELLRRRAQVDRLTDFETTLKQNAARLRTLEYFTGGNPRLVLMLYRVVSHSDVAEVRRALEKLLDEVTPYYKAKVEALPAQQRKILDHIARVSGETNEGLTPGEIAAAVRLSPNQVSSQLKRLLELGYVRAANLRGRSSWYTLSEPLYAIWHQMRFGRDTKERMRWLIVWLRAIYSDEEMKLESRKLADRFRYHFREEHSQKAQDVLEHHRWLAEAMTDPDARLRAMERVIRGKLALKEVASVKTDLLSQVNLANLSDMTLAKLIEVECLSQEQVASVKAAKIRAIDSSRDKEFAETMAAALLAYEEKNYEATISHLDHGLAIKPDDDQAWFQRAETLYDLGRHEEAITNYDRALKINSRNEDAWVARGNTLTDIGRHQDALASYDCALEIKPDEELVWFFRGLELDKLNRHEEAVESYDRSLRVKPDDEEVWKYRGDALAELSRYEEAVASYDRALAIKPEESIAWFSRGIALYNLGQYEEAIASYDRALTIDPENAEVWHRRGATLSIMDDFEGELESYSRAIEAGKKAESKRWADKVSVGMLKLALDGQAAAARKLIAESGLEEQLFPLTRAIDYLQTGNEALIEKLSPEVRGIVEEVVAKLKTAAPLPKS